MSRNSLLMVECAHRQLYDCLKPMLTWSKKINIPANTAALIVAFLLLFMTAPCLAGQQAAPFFLMGSGVLNLKNLRNNAAAKVSLLNSDGTINDAALTEVDRVFGYPAIGNGDHISPRLLFMLSYFADSVAPGKLITIESGYRSPEYNEKIRDRGANAARTSTHIDGLALDFRIDGLDGKRLWETVRAENCCGVGHYGGDIIHLDAGRPRFWEAKTSGTGSKELDYNRHIYLSTDLDRYLPQASLRLSLSGISTYGFGVVPEALLYRADARNTPAAALKLDGGESKAGDCRIIDDRRTARFLQAKLPPGLPAGRYQVKLAFCSKPFPQMGSEAVSREFEVLATQASH